MQQCSNLLPRPFCKFLFPQGDFVRSYVPPMLILMDENEGRGVDGGRGCGGGRGDGPRVRRVKESDVDNIQLFHSDVERLQFSVITVQRNHL